MQRISGPTAPNRRFVAEDPLASQPGTIITAEWLNSVQEELANLLEKAGVPLDASNTSQLHELLNGRQAALAAPADLRPATGDTIEGDILAACDTPDGTFVSTSDGSAFLCSGGHLTRVMSPLDGDTVSWATMRLDGSRVYRAQLAGGLFRFDSWVLSPGWADLDIGNGSNFAYGNLANASSHSFIGIEQSLASTFNPRATSEFIAGWLVSNKHLVVVRRLFDDESQADSLQIAVYWIAATSQCDRVVHTENLQSGGGGQYAFPNPTWLTRRTLGLRAPASEGDSTVACQVILPTSVGGDRTARLVTFDIDDANLAASNLTTATLDCATGGTIEISTADWTPGLDLIPCGDAHTLVCERLGGRLTSVSWHVGSTPRIESVDLPGGADLGMPARILGAISSGQGAAIIVFEREGRLVLARATLDSLKPPALEELWSMHVDFATRRVDMGELVGSKAAGRFDACLARFTGANANASDGLAIYLWGLCLSSRTPEWGPWTTRLCPPVKILGSNEGRVTALAVSLSHATAGDWEKLNASTSLCVSPPT